jgi:hypothetical protein
MKMINRSGKMDEFKALPTPPNFLISTGRAQKLKKGSNLDDLYEIAQENLADLHDYENSLTV